MKKTLSAFALLTILGIASAPSVRAQTVEDRLLATFNMGPTFGKLKATDETAKGMTFNFSAEKFVTEKFSLGFNLAYLLGFSETQTDDISYWSLPSALTLRLLFSENAFRPYVGLGAGVFYSKSSDNASGTSTSEWGGNFAVPVGFFWFVEDDVYLNLNWQPAITTHSLFVDDFVHAINFGVGFVL